jgi:hypothetical protein
MIHQAIVSDVHLGEVRAEVLAEKSPSPMLGLLVAAPFSLVLWLAIYTVVQALI